MLATWEPISTEWTFYWDDWEEDFGVEPCWQVSFVIHYHFINIPSECQRLVLARHYVAGMLTRAQLEIVLLPVMQPMVPPYHIWGTNAFGTQGFFTYMHFLLIYERYKEEMML